MGIVRLLHLFTVVVLSTINTIKSEAEQSCQSIWLQADLPASMLRI
jgi:hypothetical protein